MTSVLMYKSKQLQEIISRAVSTSFEIKIPSYAHMLSDHVSRYDPRFYSQWIN